MLSKWAKFHPTDRSNVYNSQARRQDFAAEAAKNHKGAHFLIQCWMFAATATKSRLRHVNLFHIYLDPESYTDMSAESAENRHLLICNLGKGRHKK